MIRLESVHKFFNKGKKNQIHVINGTSLEMGSNGLVALLGPSGCGKTTLLNTLGGMDGINSGSIYINDEKLSGRRVGDVDRIRNLNVGYVFQDYKLLDDKTVHENIAMTLRMIGIKDKDEIDKRINYVLEAVGMERYINRPADMLSGGERQRVGIARALAKNPRIILMDEPTGNLDSGNTIEVMNIVKTISKNRLVILVTHEDSIAKFYADRIIEIKDGKIENDYENDSADNLEYKLDNKFYLKDFEVHERLEDGDLAVNIYGERSENMTIDIVVKSGNIYIKTNGDEKIEPVDEHSVIEFIDDNYKNIDKSIYEENGFDLDSVADNTIVPHYSSIYSIGGSIKAGFKKLAGFSVVKKLLLVGFLLTGLFITYSVSSIFATVAVDDKDFVTTNQNYLLANISSVDEKTFDSIASYDGAYYVLPGDSSISIPFDMAYYYQTYGASSSLSGSLASNAMLHKEDIKYGEMPQADNELVVDTMVYSNIVQDDGTPKMAGVTGSKKLVGKKVTIPNMGDFTIVGVTDIGSPSIYAKGTLLINILGNCKGSSDQSDMSMSGSDGSDNSEGPKFVDYNLVKSKLKLKKGSWPKNNYEVVVSNTHRDEMAIGKNISTKINGHKVKVVGFYESKESLDDYLVTPNTVKLSLLDGAKNLAIYSKDKNAALEHYADSGCNVVDSYSHDKKEYLSNQKDSIINSLILAGIMLLISLIEIVLMVRSSFLSRIKEVGICRAIGIKKFDIYKMFWGEIFAITTVANIPGVIIMSYILDKLTEISLFESMYIINIPVVLLCFALVYVFNSIVGLLPVYNTLRKKPAEILARHDVE